MRVLTSVLLLGCLAGSFGACPDLDAGLTPFSTSGLATGLSKSSNVSITSAILLDQDLDVSFIDISGTGSLVFKRGRSTVVKTLGIMVRDSASLVIGSEACRHEDPVNIVLQGERDTVAALNHAGQKYIAVQDQGSILIFGKDKLGWTKLTATVERYNLDPENDVVFDHKTGDFSGTGTGSQGIVLYVFDNTSLTTPKVFKSFDLSKGGDTASEIKTMNKVIDTLNTVADEDVVMMAIQNHLGISADTDLSPLFDNIETVSGMESGSLMLRKGEKNDAFALIFVKGSPSLTNQAMDFENGTRWTHAEASISHGGYKLSAESYIYANSGWRSYVDFRIVSHAVGYPTITVMHDISSWDVGDEVVLTSTDYKYSHAEVRRIMSKPTTHSIQLDGELKYRHFGEIENQVDMRGEVGLLSRNIKIEGEMSRECPATNENCDKVSYDNFGGHVKALHGYGALHIEGAELYHMGQGTQMGTYPIHFHMCLNVTEKTSMVKRNSIHHTFARAVTVHGTFGTSELQIGVSVIDNVAFEISGHAYFLEDGIEMATLLQHNLGANIRNVQNNFNTDKNKATVFWITNPKVLLIDNVAAGADGFGVWYTFPEEPVGPSADLDITIYEKLEARNTPLWTIDNNVVHSNSRGGFNFDNILTSNLGAVIGCMNYKALVDPLDKDSDNAKVQITRLTAYKNYNINVWLRGGYFEMMQYSSAESKRGVQLAKGSNQQPYVKKSVFMGRSIRNFEDASYPDRTSVPHYLGVVFYDGPVYISESSFVNFDNDPAGAFVGGALGFKPKNIFSSSAASSIHDLRFAYSDESGGNRVFDGDIDDEALGFGNFAGDRVATFRDLDGSVSKCLGETWAGTSQIVKPQKFLITERCQYRPNWKMVVCNDLYGKVSVQPRSHFDGVTDFNDDGHMRRVRFSDPNDVEYEIHNETKTTPEYMVILGDDPREFYYEFQFSNPATTVFPKLLTLSGKGVERGLGAVMGVCLPEGVLSEHLQLRSHMGTINYPANSLVEVSSIEAVSSASFMNAYYRNGRMLYFKFESWLPRDPAWDKQDTDHCPQNKCPFFEIGLTQSYSYTPCFTPTDDELNTVVDIATLGISNKTCDLPASDPAYESNWGAGDYERDVDGVWGEWSSWSDCCADASETMTRYRLCDNPSPYGNGADCAGDATESAPCDQACPVDGTFTEWSNWSECSCSGSAPGSSGTSMRTRTCEGIANFGRSCSGVSTQMKPCEAGCEYGGP